MGDYEYFAVIQKRTWILKKKKKEAMGERSFFNGTRWKECSHYRIW